MSVSIIVVLSILSDLTNEQPIELVHTLSLR
eukprot:COSAG01_NODE_55854_length_322_cov_0.910314_1_plen_30_part_01